MNKRSQFHDLGVLALDLLKSVHSVSANYYKRSGIYLTCIGTLSMAGGILYIVKENELFALLPLVGGAAFTSIGLYRIRQWRRDSVMVRNIEEKIEEIQYQPNQAQIIDVPKTEYTVT